jgi:hypothetical protein
MMKIKVFRENEYSVHFDMVTEDLPEKGEYHLVPVGQENNFMHALEKEKIANLSQSFEFQIKQLAQAILLLQGRKNEC